jgi:hypothetical protein
MSNLPWRWRYFLDCSHQLFRVAVARSRKFIAGKWIKQDRVGFGGMLKADSKTMKLVNIVNVQNTPSFLSLDLELQLESFRSTIERIRLKLTSTPNAGTVNQPANVPLSIKKHVC